MNGNSEDKSCAARGREHNNVEDVHFFKKPLYLWVKSFADKESQSEESFKTFVTGNALSNALEYVGIIPEPEQSSLHLSAIFEEESQQQSRNKFPNHYESETKNRIQSLNRMFTELKSYFEDHFSQLVALKPPNSVHIVSSCHTCSVQELEKLLFLLLGAAIQGSQKQDTIKKIKRFPSEVQEALIEHIKLITDNPDVLNIKSWTEFLSLEIDDRQKIYESLLSLIRRLLLDRNQAIQAQLMSDYFSGYMYCGQRRIYEGKGFGPDTDYEDARLNAALRQLKEELHEKTELLQDCREELEVTKNRVQELQSELSDIQKQLKTCKKARDELDALLEGQEKASRLEAELTKLKKKLQDSEQFYEQVEVLQSENRTLHLENESLLEQNSFLTIEKESLKLLLNNEPLLDINSKLYDDDDEGNAGLSNLNSSKETPFFEVESELELLTEAKTFNSKDTGLEISLSNEDIGGVEDETIEPSNTAVLVNTYARQVPDIESKSLQSPSDPDKQTKRRRRRSSLLNVKRTRRAILLPLRGAQKLLPVLTDIGNSSKSNEKCGDDRNMAIRVIKVCHAPSAKRKCCSRSSWRSKSLKRRQSGGKQTIPLDMENDADEELSLSPNGPPNLSDIENCISPINGSPNGNGDSDVYFVCSTPITTTTQEEPPSIVDRTFAVNGNLNNNVPSNKIPACHVFNVASVNSPEEMTTCKHSAHFEIDINNKNTPNTVEHCACQNCCVNNPDPLPTPLPATNSQSHISVNVNKVENYSTHVSLNLNNVQFEGNSNEFSPHSRCNRSHISNKTIKITNGSMYSPHEPSSSEDDDSVWYEYGCV